MPILKKENLEKSISEKDISENADSGGGNLNNNRYKQEENLKKTTPKRTNLQKGISGKKTSEKGHLGVNDLKRTILKRKI